MNVKAETFSIYRSWLLIKRDLLSSYRAMLIRMLDLDENRRRVVAPEVGGGFGADGGGAGAAEDGADLADDKFQRGLSVACRAQN